MSEADLSIWLAAFTAAATTAAAAAALVAAYATWRAPVNATQLAAQLQEESFRKNAKLNLFATLVQNRRTIEEPESVKMLNLVDIVYENAQDVRHAWADLHNGLNDARLFQTSEGGRLIDEKIMALLSAMAKDLGLSHTISYDSLQRIYYPNAMAEDRRLRHAQQAALRSNLEAAQRQLTTNAADRQATDGAGR